MPENNAALSKWNLNLVVELFYGYGLRCVVIAFMLKLVHQGLPRYGGCSTMAMNAM